MSAHRDAAERPKYREPSIKWSIRLEVTSDDGDGAPNTTTLGVTGEWDSSVPRSFDECVVMDMASVIKMLQISDHVFGVSDAKTVIDAFEESWQ